MKATLEKLENSRAVLAVEVGAAQVEDAIEQACRKLARRADIPGFRKGRAPRPLVERYVGREAVWREALENLLGEAYSEAVRQTGIEPVAEPDFHDVQARPGEPVTFRVAVDVRPQVTLGDYRSLRIPVQVPEVTAEQVERYLEALREKHSRFVADEEGETGPGASAWITYTGTIAGQEVSSPPVLIEFGREQLLPGIEDRLLGLRAGEERDVAFTLPDDLDRAELAGQEVRLRVRVHSVGRREVPELDAEFASYLGVPGPEELRVRVENTLRQAAAREAEAEAVARAVEAVVAQAEVSGLPASLVERRFRTLWNGWVRELSRVGLTPEAQAASQGTTLEAVEQQFRERAAQEIKTELVLEEIARREELHVAEDEVRERLDKAGLPAAAEPAVRRALTVQKAVDFLREVALVGSAAQ